MNSYRMIFCAFYFFSHVFAQNVEPNRRHTKSLPVVDALISRLEWEQWKPDNEVCLRATMDMLEGVKNNTLWATWDQCMYFPSVWDSMQLPTGSLYGVQAYTGNYDQCLQAPWSSNQRHPGLRSQYCVVEVRGQDVDQAKTFGLFDDTKAYYRTSTKDGGSFSQYYFGACLPSICSPSSVAKISHHLLQLTHLPDGDVFVDPQTCETAGEVLEYPTGFYVFWAVVGILIVITIISTLSNNYKTNHTALGTIIQSFCLKRNYRSLFTVSRDDVKVMHGMRFVSAVFIIAAHEGFFTMWAPVINRLDLNKFLTSPFGLTLMHLEVAVDSFFAMSGLLLVRGLMLGKQKNVVYTLLKRYIRLIGPFALCIAFYATTCEHMTNGPLWKATIRWETRMCSRYWWKSLLMANSDIKTVCYCVTWFISCDFQLTILGTFLVLLFRKNRKLGVTAFVTIAVALTVHLGLTVYWKQLDMVPFNYKSIVAILKRQHTDLNHTYFRAHARAGPYLVGMVMGYIIAAYRPAEHRNAIGKKWSVIITTVSVLVGMTVLCIGAIFAGRPYDPLESAMVVATNRTIWGAMVCAIIGVCEYGSLSLIPSLLGWPGLVPLSKLSYCIYLIHPIVMQLNKFSARGAATFAIYTLLLNGLGVLVLTCALSLVLHLILEAPFSNISDALLSDKSKHLEQNGIKVEISKNENGALTQRHEQNGHKPKLC